MNTTSVLLLNKSTANFQSLNCQQLQHVIVQVLEAEGLYTFAELLALDQVKSVKYFLSRLTTRAYIYLIMFIDVL